MGLLRRDGRLLHVLRRLRARVIEGAGVDVRRRPHADTVGTTLGTVVAPVLRRKIREEWILAGTLVVPSVPLIFPRPVRTVASGSSTRHRRSPERRRAGDSRSTVSCNATAPTSHTAGRSRGSRTALSAPVGRRRGGGRHLPERRSLGDLPGRARPAVRRPVVRRRRAAARGRRPARENDPRRTTHAKTTHRGPERIRRAARVDGRMPLEVRPITESELPVMLEVDRRGFGRPPADRNGPTAG